MANSGENGVPQRLGRLVGRLGPGLITGASDDDPSGIATYSQVGAQFGFGMAWTMPFSFPLMAAIQEVCARLGRITGMGIAANLRRHYPRQLLWSVVALLLIANVFNLAADLCAMGDAVRLLAGGADHGYVVLFGVVSALLQVFTSYDSYVRILKWVTLSLFAYVATVLVIEVPWGQVLARTFLPAVGFSKGELTAVVAVLGTTISPYLFFWQSSQEAEDRRCRQGARPLAMSPAQARQELSRIRLDTYAGMFFSNLIGYFVIITAAATLNARGLFDIQTSGQAARALQPLAGELASAVFAAGIIGTGLLAVPVLAGSVAYAVAEAMDRPVGLGRLPREAGSFYGTIVAATAVGVALNFAKIDPIRALYWSAILNGVVAAPLMALVLSMTSRRAVMGEFTLPGGLAAMGWVGTAIMALTVVALFATLI